MAPSRKQRISSSEKESSQSSEEESSSSSEQYEVNERILCSDNGKFYEAKILKIETDQDNDVFYTIHYHNWNAEYDEVISENVIDTRFRKVIHHQMRRRSSRRKAKFERARSNLQPSQRKPLQLKKTPLYKHPIFRHN